VVGKDVNPKIKIYWYFLNLDIALECARSLTQNPLLEGNTVPKPNQVATTSLATKALYILFATILLVFAAMLALTMMHP
jgi:hypothetical protein